MKNFHKIAEGVDVLPLALTLKQRPDLWDSHPWRRTAEGTPHAQMQDIWVRYRRAADLTPENVAQKVSEPHFATWYPAYYALPQLREIIFSMMARVEGVHLGGVLITRIPPGCRIEPHADKGWHPKFYNTKLYLPIETNPKCWFRCEDERVVMAPGDIWWLDNTVEHEIVNEGHTDRITLIVCIRREG